MARKQIRVSRRMLFTWFMLAGFICLLAPQKLTGKLQLAFAHLFRWPLSLTRSFVLSARHQPVADFVSRSEYNRLQNHLANIVEQRNQAHRKLEKLSGLRDRLPLEGAKLVLANVAMAPDGPKDELIINRGRADGLAAGQFVLADNSIIGSVSDVASRQAKVRLITDPTFNIPVKIPSSNINAVLKGAGGKIAKLPLVSIKHKVKTGEMVYVCEKPGFLDTAIITASVTECKRDDQNPLLWDITLEPVCDVAAVQDVAVIIMNPNR